MGFWKKEEKTHFERDRYGKVIGVEKSNGHESVYKKFKPEHDRMKLEQRNKRLEQTLAWEKKKAKTRQLKQSIHKTRQSYRPQPQQFGFFSPPPPRRSSPRKHRKKSNRKKTTYKKRQPAHPWDWYSGFI